MAWCGGPSRKLHLTSDRDSHSQDSAFSSHIVSSQIQDSQCSDFSQLATQEFFSQNNSGPQSETNTYPGMKKLSMYEKWLSKRSLFKREPSASTINESKLNAQVGIAASSSVSAFQGNSHLGSGTNSLPSVLDCNLKSSDRDVLKQVTHAIHDCSTEIKSTMLSMREKFEMMSELTNDQLGQTITSFLEDVWKHQEKMQQLLKEQDKNRTIALDLEVKLAKKEAKITELEDQLQHAKEDNTPRFARALRNEMKSPHILLQKKLEEILEWTQDCKELQNQHLKEYKQCLETHYQHHLEVHKIDKDNSKEKDKGILSEMKKISDQLELKQQMHQNQLTEEIKNVLQKYKSDLEDMIKHQLNECFHQQCHDLKTTIATKKEDWQGIFKKQSELAKKQFGDAMKNQAKENSHHLSDMVETLKESFQRIKDLLQSKHCDKDLCSQVENRINLLQLNMNQQLQDISFKLSCDMQSLHKLCQQSSPKFNMSEQPKGFVKNVDKQKLNLVTGVPDPLSSSVRENRKLPVTSRTWSNNKTFFEQTDFISESHRKEKSLTDQKKQLDNEYPYYKHCSTLKDSNKAMRKNVPGSALCQGSAKNSRFHMSVGSTENPQTKHARTNFPFAECELSLTLESAPPPILAAKTLSQQNRIHQESQIVMARNPVTQPEKRPCISVFKKKGRKKVTSSKNKTADCKEVQKMTVIHSQQADYSETKIWTRSQYRSIKELQPALPSTDKICENSRTDLKLAETHKSVSSHRAGKRVNNHTADKKSVFDFDDIDPCNLSVNSRKRNYMSSMMMENMSLASFISNRCQNIRKDNKSENDETGSSPAVSITEMTIKRKVRTPYHMHRLWNREEGLCMTDAKKEQKSPEPTFLSQI